MSYSMKLCSVLPCNRAEIKDFVEKWHYSKSINGLMSDHCFKMLDPDGNMIGAMIYGRMAMANSWKPYGTTQDDVIELRRLCCVDDTPKNAESYFIGKTLRMLKNATNIKTVVSYADPEYGHGGVIYKASNFDLIGTTAKGKVIWCDGKKYHDKAIRTKYKGVLKPFAVRLIEALANGTAYYATTVGKHIYRYDLYPRHTKRKGS